MRHQVKGRKLNRTASHRKATLQALSVALIKEQRIRTTVAKAKELRRFVEPLITKAKTDTTHNRRQVFSALQDKYAVTELFDNIGPEAKDRPGGYTRVLKLGFRLGDSAEMAMIELVDFNDVKPEIGGTKTKKTRRAGKSNKPTGSEEEETKAKEKPIADKKKESAKSEKTDEKKAVKEEKTETKASEDKESDSDSTDEKK